MNASRPQSDDIKMTRLPEQIARKCVVLVSADADDEARFELHCAACGCGVVVRIAPDSCRMCHGSVWEHARRAETRRR